MTNVQVSLPDSLFAALRKAPHEGAPRASDRCGDPLVLAERSVDGACGRDRRHDSPEFLAELVAAASMSSSWTRRTSLGNCGMSDVLVVNASPLIPRQYGSARALADYRCFTRDRSAAGVPSEVTSGRTTIRRNKSLLLWSPISCPRVGDGGRDMARDKA
jgi:hypothetical protein